MNTQKYVYVKNKKTNWNICTKDSYRGFNLHGPVEFTASFVISPLRCDKSGSNQERRALDELIACGVGLRGAPVGAVKSNTKIIHIVYFYMTNIHRCLVYDIVKRLQINLQRGVLVSTW